MNIYNRFICIFLLFIGLVVIGCMSVNCSSSLAKYFGPNSKHIVSMTATLHDGNVYYTRHYLYWYPNGGFLTNGDGFAVLSSGQTECINGVVEPFGINRQETSFYDRSGIIIRQNGTVSFSPLWKPNSDSSYNFNLICEDSIIYGMDQGNAFSFVFTDDKSEIGGSCR
ncbi:hypothetical protein PPL_08225 [Heterostelium album PN500]|uniref:Uncharacterized protein n=1 Tax=Heterostelium pallidum (strain ATCC 26659 / Pp 5 / PN500) TaxID=670386 RepID=D3BIZ0_HETP5|nr:hypothetical protein PPL_08225 [Heterostelium album PN500]EFA78764.1 hypothetical protein PPL_08225 [Heterostelium album PN500]|eukprot:XP_020430888.1 hypothetical protein PPL_08225 [Heterostelium album PN500]